MNPATFMKSADEMRARQKEAGALGYQSRVALKVALQYRLDKSVIDQAVKYCRAENCEIDFLPMIKGDESCRFPPEIFIDKLNNIKIGDLLLDIKETKPWEAFLSYLKFIACGQAALVFPVLDKGSWVVHNMITYREKGVPRLIIPSGEGGVQDAELLPLGQFLKEYTYN